MRVIAGQYRRRTLVAPAGHATRPTSDRLRETLFNVLAPRLTGARFLDLYAGSGANGIEALSRGAAYVVFVEQAMPAVAATRANLAALKLSAGYAIEVRAVAAWLRESARQVATLQEPARRAGSTSPASFDVIFLDPPYDQFGEYATTLASLGHETNALVAPGGIVVAEHRRAHRDGADVPADRYGRLERTRVIEQGDAALSFYAHGPGALDVDLKDTNS
jgi:16S rRNA (guanine(966)-N(2))-methyltransferase RsmD